MLYLVAAVALSIAVGSWWMQRIAFTPDATPAVSAAILGDPDIRLDINSLVSAATSPVVGRSVTEISTEVETQILRTRPGAIMMAPIMEALHERVIGLRDDPVEITGQQMVEIIRDQQAAGAPTVTMPVSRIGVLSNTRSALGWMMLIGAGLAALALVLGTVLRPERRDVLRGLAETAFAVAVAMLLFGYLVPVHVMAAIDSQTWTAVVPRLALRTLPFVLGTTAVLAVLGGLLLLASRSTGKRRQWSTPVAANRLPRGEARWS